MSKWLLQKVAQEHTAKAERRWFTHEMQTALDTARPEIDVSSVRARLKKPEVESNWARKLRGLRSPDPLGRQPLRFLEQAQRPPYGART